MEQEKIDFLLKIMDDIERKLVFLRNHIKLLGVEILEGDLAKPLQKLPITPKLPPFPSKPEEEIENNKTKEDNSENYKICEKCNKKYKKGKIRIIDNNLIQEFICKKCGTSKFLKQPL